MRSKKKIKKYGHGTGRQGVVRNYIESPDEALYENQVAMAKADYEAATNPWVHGLNLVGNAAIEYGGNMHPAARAIGGGLKTGLQVSNSFALGGEINSVPVEVEGKEVAETPQGQLMEFKGDSHENGGIDINLPAGTEIFSKRIKVDGVSMADRKKKRGKKEITLAKLLEDNASDIINKNTLNRVKVNNKKQEQFDSQIQQLITALLNNQGYEQDREKHGFGDIIGSADANKKQSSNNFPRKQMDAGIFGEMTGGDWAGLAGNLVSTFGPMINTKKNRAGDTPNINHYKDFGNDALDVLDETKGYVADQRDNALMDLETARTSNIKRNRNTARGINTLRALDLASAAQANQAQGNIYNAFAKQMMQILGQEASVENQQDSMVMQGEEKRDLADRQDRDSYFAQMAKDITSMGRGIQETGKDINQIYSNKENKGIITELKNLGLTDNQIKAYMEMILKSKGQSKVKTKGQ